MNRSLRLLIPSNLHSRRHRHYRVREKDGRLQSYPAMTLSLTYDHRAIDGAPASRLLQDLVRTLENFPVLLMQEGLPMFDLIVLGGGPGGIWPLTGQEAPVCRCC